ncbi:ABC-2 type transport system permease protein [Streptomyces sp. SAI-208]|uniref:ABC transporter permease n=1 Tax=unclassified Streptomyces TaxID=2593676 RepID=UPI002474BDD8|nr:MULTISPECIES: ABC transporter permease [unclassified Streptomyces]MDH6517434.1 ABC-2 type transport system permease protein [Streptomyces sp. SAI-090]MDH6568713.1 ABC-2 type transport system permease protein [Streptomyces sp. SAI-117]MDH6586337.1 ABC-2 type transport system permease protein [Streptomyces sp. SAI-133]MDH6608253.1 ABC-2 type transport system permease protein [Streptomyces sp. SAI-208]MDH6618477.1 ABC-2 type transport system permease protein [Streptomyces sp. SAI-135]
MSTYALTDSWTMTRRELAHWARQPVRVLVGLVFPVMLLLMFGYLVGGGRGVDGDYVDYLVPGMLALTMAFGLESTMIAVTQDLNKGVIDRFRSMPMANGAVLVGRSAADMLQSVLSLAAMTGVGYAIGWRAQGGPTGLLAAVGLLLLFRFAMLWIGIHLAMIAGKPEMVQAVQILVWPVGFLSNAFATPDSMPGWLGTVVDWNPMSQTATAVRDQLGGPGGEPGHVWAAVAWPLALLAVFFPLAVRRFTRLSR